MSPFGSMLGDMSETTRIYYTRTSVGDKHWVTGQAYPYSAECNYDAPKIMKFAVDASAVYTDPTFKAPVEPLEPEDLDLESEELGELEEADRLVAELTANDGPQDELSEPRKGPYWGVRVTNPPEEGDHHWFDVPIEDDGALGSERYALLAEAVEARLGRTGLMILVH